MITPQKPRNTERPTSRASIYEKISPGMSLLGSTTHRSSSVDLDVKVPARENSISAFTRQQNESLAMSLKKFDNRTEVVSDSPNIDAKKLLKSEIDYTRIINKLNRVISPNRNKRPIQFQDSDPIDIALEENQLQYCKIFVKGKKTPLVVKIQRFRGQVITYMSITDNEPGPNKCERYFRTDYFEMRENSASFKYDNIFLGIKAVEDSVLRITINFGKITTLDELKRIRRQLSMRIPVEGDLREELEEETMVRSPQKNTKNFIVMNKSIKILNSCVNAEKLKERGINWNTKRELVIDKKKVILKEKLKKHKDFLNKRILKMQRERVEKEKQDIKNLEKRFCAGWLALAYFISSTSAIESLVKQNKRKKIKKITWNLSAYRIQRCYSSFSKVGIRDKQFLRSQHVLMLFKDTISSLNKKFIYNKQICKFISQVAHTYILSHQFNNLAFKTRKIQRAVRIYLNIKRKRMRNLVKIWEDTCEIYLFHRGSTKASRKRQSVNLVNIQPSKRNKILAEYYHNCVVKHIEKMRKYQVTMIIGSKSKAFMSVMNALCHLTPPEFEYIPSKEIIENLIEVSLRIR